jgi:DNA-directed RNA polymerase subunit RPC12/RpoP
MRCTYCGSQLHTVTNCPRTWAGSARRAAMRCSYCGAPDHKVRACPKTWEGSARRTWEEDSIKDEFVRDKR